MHNITGKNLTSLRDDNIAVILKLLHENKTISRASIAKQTGLSQVAITNIIADFIEKGLVNETGMLGGTKGRRSIGIALNGDYRNTVGVRINRDYLQVGVFDLFGRPHNLVREDIDIMSDPSDVMHHLDGIIARQIEASSAPISGIGIALPGPLFPHEGKMLLMSGFPGWDIVNIREELAGTCRKYGVSLSIEHDANCGALAERWYGVGYTGGSLLYLVVDKGIGCGMIIDGKVYGGKNGLSGELGHVSIDYNGPICECGNRGCLELYCSTKAVEDEYKRRRVQDSGYQGDDVSFLEIADGAVEGDETAINVIQRAAKFLGIGLVGMINILNPDTIILADRMSEAGELFFTALRKALKSRLLPEIYESLDLRRCTQFSCDPVLMGAGALIFEDILRSPAKMLFGEPQ